MQGLQVCLNDIQTYVCQDPFHLLSCAQAAICNVIVVVLFLIIAPSLSSRSTNTVQLLASASSDTAHCLLQNSTEYVLKGNRSSGPRNHS